MLAGINDEDIKDDTNSGAIYTQVHLPTYWFKQV